MDRAELLANVRALAALAYTPQQVAVALAVPRETMESEMLDEEGDLYRAYWDGWYENDIKLRNSINKLAIAGSSPAQAMMYKIMTTNKLLMN